MTHMPAEMRIEAEAAIAAMRAAAREARRLHARAELMRHMLTTAAKLRGRPDAVPGVVAEWMAAWGLDAAAWPSMADAMQLFTAAACAFEADPNDATDAGWRDSLRALDQALTAEGMTLADQMAWRSECAHGWWALVEPLPPSQPQRALVGLAPGAPFWEAGCRPLCLGAAQDGDITQAGAPPVPG